MTFAQLAEGVCEAHYTSAVLPQRHAAPDGKRHTIAPQWLNTPNGPLHTGLMHESADNAWSTVGDLRIAAYRFPGGVSRTTIVENGKGFLVFSPGAPLADEARALADRSNDVTLIAPSLGHTAGIPAWLEHLSAARVVATTTTAKRLRSRRAVATTIEPAHASLAAGVELLTPPGNALGEIWMRVDNDAGVTWVLCDAFSNLRQLAAPFWLRQLQRLYGIRLGLRLGAAFRRNTADANAFITWLELQLGRGCDRIVPCHGEVDEAPGLAGRLLAEARAALRR